MDFSNVKSIVLPEGQVKQIASNGVVLWKSGYKNWVRYSINADGTIYNNGLGYKNGYRVRSGGAEAVLSSATCVGFIPVDGLSVIRVGESGGAFVGGGVGQAVNVFDSAFNNLGQIAGNNGAGYGIFANSGSYSAYNARTVIQKENYWQWTVPPASSGVVYIRVTAGGFNTGPPGAKLIITINEEIT